MRGDFRLLADIQALKQVGKLFSQDLWKDVEQEAFQHTKPVLKAMCLHVAGPHL